MGCSTSKPPDAAFPLPRRQPETPLSEWTEEDVARWFSSLPAEVQGFRGVLLPANGVKVAAWTSQHLMRSCGMAPNLAALLLVHRDRAASGPMTPCDSSIGPKTVPEGPLGHFCSSSHLQPRSASAASMVRQQQQPKAPDSPRTAGRAPLSDASAELRVSTYSLSSVRLRDAPTSSRLSSSSLAAAGTGGSGDLPKIAPRSGSSSSQQAGSLALRTSSSNSSGQKMLGVVVVAAGGARLILRSDLQAFWEVQFGTAEAAVPWSSFWKVFPARLADAGLERPLADQLCNLLATDAARRAFQRAVATRAGSGGAAGAAAAASAGPLAGRVSMRDISAAFDADAGGLVEQVRAMLLGGPQQAAEGASEGGGGCRLAGPAEDGDLVGDMPTVTGMCIALATGVPAGTGVTTRDADAGDSDSESENWPSGALAPAAPVSGRSMLPSLAAGYCGREEEALDVAQHLLTRGSLVLLGPPGIGKSSLAADAGWRLHRHGRLPGGALWVDLLEVRSAADVAAALGDTLDVELEGLAEGDSHGPARVCVALQMLLSAAGAGKPGPAAGGGALRLLLVVNNADEALKREPAARALRAALMAAAGVPGVRVLVASRLPLGPECDAAFHERHVEAISAPAGTKMVLAAIVAAATATGDDGAKPALQLQQAACLAAACCGVPAALQLVAEALASGRVTAEAALQAVEGRRSPSPGSAPNTPRTPRAPSSDGGTVPLVLLCLKPPQRRALAQLCALPHAAPFGEAAAALALSAPLPQARLLVDSLCKLGLLEPQQVSAGGGSGGEGGGDEEEGGGDEDDTAANAYVVPAAVRAAAGATAQRPAWEA